jgi:hypothetical protein
MADIEPLVALQADQVGLKRGSYRCCQRGLPDTSLAFEEERPFQAERKKHGNRQAAVRDVMLPGETVLEVGDGSGKNGGDP